MSLYASTITFTGPNSCVGGKASAPFTVTIGSGHITGYVTIIPNDGGMGGTFTPSSVVLWNSNKTGTFTYTAATLGKCSIGITNSGNLVNPPKVQVNIVPTEKYTLTPSVSSGTESVASLAFTVTLPPNSLLSPIITPNDNLVGGSFTPTSLTLSNTSPSGTFTYTPVTTGAITISTTNDSGLIDPPSVTYTSVATCASYTLVGPTTGPTGSPSVSFELDLGPGALGSPVTITPSDASGGGTFIPTTVILSSGSPSGTFTYTPANTTPHVISTTNGGSLTDPTSITFTAHS